MAGILSIALIVAFYVGLIIVNALKGRLATAVWGLLLPTRLVRGAFRLAKPNSWWDRRFYRGEKHTRAVMRHEERRS